MVVYHNDAIVFFCRRNDMSLSYVTVRVMFSTSPSSVTTDPLSLNTFNTRLIQKVTIWT